LQDGNVSRLFVLTGVNGSGYLGPQLIFLHAVGLALPRFSFAAGAVQLLLMNVLGNRVGHQLL
jgi:hypothetical protein